MTKFLRRIWSRYSKLGKRRKKKQVWRKPKGRDNKMREKRKGYPVVVSIGYKQDKKLRGAIGGANAVLIKNVAELEKVKKNEVIIIGNIGKKKKIEVAKKAKEMKIEVHNLNIEKFLEKINKKKIEKTEDKKQKTKGGKK